MVNAVVSGIGRHSLGEAFLRAYARSGAFVVGIDRTENPFLREAGSLRQCIFDLNPLNFSGGAASFAQALRNKLDSYILEESSRGVRLLVQCAGAYGYSPFLKGTAGIRSRILGLNVLGVTELLHSVMDLNASRGLKNEDVLTHVLVGSSQGLYARRERAVYAASKAYGIDFCTSLAEERALARSVYLAVGPIDTPMMHRNHWVNKAGGSEDFYDRLLEADSSAYRSIFVDCDDAAVQAAARTYLPAGAQGVLRTMTGYRRVRSKQFDEELGVLSPAECAEGLVQIISKSGWGSGVFMMRPPKRGKRLSIAFAPFTELSRRQLFDSVCRVVS